MRPTLTSDASGGEHEPPSLLCIDGDRSFILRIPPSGELVIGRGIETGLSVEDPLVSRNHARLVLGPDGLRIVDLAAATARWSTANASTSTGCCGRATSSHSAARC